MLQNFKNTLLAMIEEDEGYRQYPYLDTKSVLTVGIGRNLESTGISREEARYMALNDLQKCHDQLDKMLEYRGLNDARKMVVLSMAFNLGLMGLSKFVKFFKALEARDYDTAAAEMLNSKWSKDVGKRAIRLAKIMKEGEL